MYNFLPKIIDLYIIYATGNYLKFDELL
jgi:hypothetical protein